MTKIEQVARAIYERRNGPGCKPWSRLPHNHQEPYLGDARAAVEAMRGLPESLYAEIEQLRYDVWHTPSEAEAARLSHEYAIDAILKEEKP
jgi:hypothetical protein